MKRMIGLLVMVVGVVGFNGCGGDSDSDSPTGPSNEVTKGPDGQTLEVGTIKWDNGNIKVEFQYFRDIAGKVVQYGYYNDYYESGKVKWESNYVYGKLEGKSVWYYESGEVEREGNYVDGKRDGKSVYYDEEGNITRERCWEMGEEVDCPKDE